MKILTPACSLAILALVASAPAAPADRPSNPAELGVVRWSGRLEETLKRADEVQRPVLLLFQEIPGCAGCREFGGGPMSHPLIVEAIEDEFVPVAVYNNREGYDATILKRYDEPAWNFPVMRLLDADGKDLVRRRDRIWTTGAVAERLIEALEAAGRPVPAYLRLVAAESTDAELERATFAMHCYWEGEAALGRLDGVTATEAAWVDRHEVVRVTFDPRRISYERLLAEARHRQCATRIFAHDNGQLRTARSVAPDDTQRLEAAPRPASPSDRKFALQRSALRFLPLTPMQATRVNGALRGGGDPAPWLSPRQQALLTRLESALARTPDALGTLRPPETIEGLAAYAVRLDTALETAAACQEAASR